MDQPCNLHPLGLAVSADGLRSLQKVLNLRKLGLEGTVSISRSRASSNTSTYVWVRFVDERVEFLHRFPDT